MLICVEIILYYITTRTQQYLTWICDHSAVMGHCRLRRKQIIGYSEDRNDSEECKACVTQKRARLGYEHGVGYLKDLINCYITVC